MSFAEGIKLSALANRLKVGPMKRLYKYYVDGAINMAGGLPMEKCFPFTEMDVKLADGTSYNLERSKGLQLNYHRGTGIPALANWVYDHSKQVHGISAGHQTCITVGSTDAWGKTLSIVDTDVVLLDQYAYGAAVTACETHGKKICGVPGDSHGMLPDQLRKSIIQSRAKGLAANLLYLVPVGQNPQGLTIPFQRKREIYEVCRELDVAIAEDDAYYYLYFGAEGAKSQGLQSLPRSLASIDEDGRVIRFDSCSKFLAPGMRLGWVTAPEKYIEKYILLQEISVNIPCSVSQSVFHGLATHWGAGGFNNNLIKIQDHYRSQCDTTVSALRAHLDSSICQFTRPDCGMFIWLRFPTLRMSSFDLFKVLASKGVICVPGSDFFVPGVDSPVEATETVPSLRLTFAAASPEQIAKGIAVMADEIKQLLKQ